jgi:molybdopterin/thiamine biosynthesis adenylyltransferase
MERLPDKDLFRYERQMMLRGFGLEGQKRLKQARVMVAGIGGLGSAASLYLAAAGVGYLRLIDYDVVELSNLNRQVVHWSTDLERPKVESAAMKLTQLNPDVKIDAINEMITRDSVAKLFEGIDLAVDGQDTMQTRMIINEECVKRRIPYIYAAVYGLEGYMTTIIPHVGPCLKCVYPAECPPQEKVPVVGPTPGVMGCLEATEVLKLMTGIGRLAVGRLIVYDGERMSFQEVAIKRDLHCPVCGKPKKKICF